MVLETSILPHQLLLKNDKKLSNANIWEDEWKRRQADAPCIHPFPHNIHLWILYLKNIHCHVFFPFKQHRHHLPGQHISVWREEAKTIEGQWLSPYLGTPVNAGVSRHPTSTTGPQKTFPAGKSAPVSSRSAGWKVKSHWLCLGVSDNRDLGLQHLGMKTGQVTCKGSEI